MMTGRYPAAAASELSTPKAPPAGSGFALGTALTEGAPLFCSSILLSPFFIKTGKGPCLLQLQRSKRPVQEAKLYERRILKSKYRLSDIE